MSPTPPQALARRAPCGLLGMLVLVVLCERYVADRPLEFTEVMPTTWRYSAEKAPKEGARADLLCFGSSLIKFGALPRVIERQTGRSGFNLAVYGGRLASTYYLLEKALRAGARPSAILLDCHDGPTPVSAKDKQHEALVTNERNWPELLTFSEALRLSLDARDASFFASMVVAKVLPSARARFEVRNRVMAALGGKPTAVDPVRYALLRNWNINQGTMLMPPDSEPPAPADEAADLLGAPPAELDRSQWVRNHLLERYLGKIVALADAHRFKVFLLLPPLTPKVQAAQDREGLTLFHTRLATRLVREHSNVYVIDGRRSGYDGGQFVDKTHLNYRGAICLSEDVGAIVAEAFAGDGGPRWRPLPRYRERPTPGLVEHLGESRVAVDGAGGLRR